MPCSFNNIFKKNLKVFVSIKNENELVQKDLKIGTCHIHYKTLHPGPFCPWYCTYPVPVAPALCCC